MYRNYRLINEQENIALILALLTEPLTSPIFASYLGMLVEEFQPMPRNLIHKLHEFGWHWILKSFEIDKLKGWSVMHRMPQDDFLGRSHNISKRDFENKQFEHDGEKWIVFEILESRPFPTTNFSRVDRIYYCAPAAQIEI